MIHYLSVQVQKEEPFKIICNKCGNSFAFNEYPSSNFTHINHTYGYGSEKDGTKFISHICEQCIDEFYATFVVPPQTIAEVVVGEDPGLPKIIIDKHDD